MEVKAKLKTLAEEYQKSDEKPKVELLKRKQYDLESWLQIQA